MAMMVQVASLTALQNQVVSLRTEVAAGVADGRCGSRRSRRMLTHLENNRARISAIRTMGDVVGVVEVVVATTGVAVEAVADVVVAKVAREITTVASTTNPRTIAVANSAVAATATIVAAVIATTKVVAVAAIKVVATKAAATRVAVATRDEVATRTMGTVAEVEVEASTAQLVILLLMQSASSSVKSAMSSDYLLAASKQFM